MVFLIYIQFILPDMLITIQPYHRGKRTFKWENRYLSSPICRLVYGVIYIYIYIYIFHICGNVCVFNGMQMDIIKFPFHPCTTSMFQWFVTHIAMKYPDHAQLNAHSRNYQRMRALLRYSMSSSSYIKDYHIKGETKWTLFCREHFFIHFLVVFGLKYRWIFLFPKVQITIYQY